MSGLVGVLLVAAARRRHNRGVLFSSADWPGIADGSITVTYRRWKRPQAVAGGRYRTPAGFIVVDAVDVVPAHQVPSTVVLRGDASLPVTRVRFHRDDDHDPRAELAADTEVDVPAVTKRLDRMDAASLHGPWTRATLEAIEAAPRCRAADLASKLGRGKDDWKRDVRKLKELGLTLSLEVGYLLSPRGEAYLAAVRRLAPGGGAGSTGSGATGPTGAEGPVEPTGG